MSDASWAIHTLAIDYILAYSGKESDMSRKAVVLCGVPTEHCSGGKYTTDQKLSPKCHGTHLEAFNCMRKYLLRTGYTQIGPREFQPPGGGPIRVLTKKSRFGARLRSGKLGERFMPEDREAGNQGVVISC